MSSNKENNDSKGEQLLDIKANPNQISNTSVEEHGNQLNKNLENQENKENQEIQQNQQEQNNITSIEHKENKNINTIVNSLEKEMIDSSKKIEDLLKENQQLKEENENNKQLISSLQKQTLNSQLIIDQNISICFNPDKFLSSDMFITGNTELMKLRDETAKQKKEIKKLTGTITDLQNENVKILNEKNTLKKDYDELRIKYKEISNILSSEQGKNNKLVSLLNSLNSTIKMFKKDKFELEEIMIKQEIKINENDSKINHLINLLNKKNKKINESIQCINQLEEKIKAIQSYADSMNGLNNMNNLNQNLDKNLPDNHQEKNSKEYQLYNNINDSNILLRDHKILLEKNGTGKKFRINKSIDQIYLRNNNLNNNFKELTDKSINNKYYFSKDKDISNNNSPSKMSLFSQIQNINQSTSLIESRNQNQMNNQFNSANSYSNVYKLNWANNIKEKSHHSVKFQLYNQLTNKHKLNKDLKNKLLNKEKFYNFFGTNRREGINNKNLYSNYSVVFKKNNISGRDKGNGMIENEDGNIKNIMDNIRFNFPPPVSYNNTYNNLKDFSNSGSISLMQKDIINETRDKEKMDEFKDILNNLVKNI